MWRGYDQLAVDQESEPGERAEDVRQNSRSRSSTAYSIFMSIYAVLVTGMLIYYITASKSKSIPVDLIFNPARDSVKYEVSPPIPWYSDGYREDPLFGDPSPALDQEWIETLRHSNVRLSEQEFRKYNQSGILLGDNSGYLATPTAYHDLHCLRFLHKSLYPSYYSLEPNDSHYRHCLHNLFHSVTCNADMTMRVMKWTPHTILPSPVDHEHVCINWDNFVGWARSRSVDTGAPGMLVHPTKGKVFPNRMFSGDEN